MEVPLGEEAYLMTGYRSRRVHPEMQKFESLDYDIYEDSLHEKEGMNQSERQERTITIMMWFWTVSIGVVVALMAFFVIYGIQQISLLKFQLVMFFEMWGFLAPLGILLAVNLVFALLAMTVILIIEPVAAGSGVPEVIAFLNGVKIPRIARIKTMMVKLFATILGVPAGLAIGPEGPIVQLGGIVGASLAQGKSTSFGVETGYNKAFRNDHFKMDFVACGAAAGLAAAFGSPIGGTLFVLEEGASFWNPPLIWRIFLCAMTGSFTFNFFLSGVRLGTWGSGFNSPGMLFFGSFEVNNVGHTWTLSVLPCFILIGALGGLFGGLLNYINSKLLPIRKKYIHVAVWRRALEVAVVVTLTTVLLYVTVRKVHLCVPLPDPPYEYSYRQLGCPDGMYNDMATIMYNTQEEAQFSLVILPNLHQAVNQVFHWMGHYRLLSLGLLFLVYYGSMVFSVGLTLSSGLLIPSILSGCMMGRFVGELFSQYTDYQLDPGTAALIGGASMLCGVTRMTLSLAAIILESTNDMQYGLAIITSLLTAKIVGDLLNHSFYELLLHFKMFPYLAWEPPHDFQQFRAIDVMNSNVVTLCTQETVRRIVDVLQTTSHNAFPVNDADELRHFRGIVSRSVLLHLLQKRMFGDLHQQMRYNPTVADFQEAYPRQPPLQRVVASLDEADRDKVIDITPYMNAYPYTLDRDASLSRVFRLFRTMGLRHIVVVSKVNTVVGIITRKDLTHLEWVVAKDEPLVADEDNNDNEPNSPAPANVDDALLS